MEFVAPIAVGIVCGMVSGVPYAFALRSARRSHDASMVPALVAVGASIVVIALSILVAWAFWRDMLLIFACALVVVFLVVVVASVALFGRKPRS